MKTDTPTGPGTLVRHPRANPARADSAQPGPVRAGPGGHGGSAALPPAGAVA